MDPITQGALGAAMAEATVGKRAGNKAWLIGALSGMAPDLDVLIRSSDPLVGILYHRHFTHSLLFVPLGGLLVALPFLWREADRSRWRWIVLASVIGLATHAPLDCGTSYGTLYFWPLSDARIALDFLPIIDLLYTVPLLLGVWLARRRADRRWLYAGLAIAHLYAAHCLIQRNRALDVQQALLAERGQVVKDGQRRVNPAPLSNALWRGIAITDDNMIQADFIVVPWRGEPTVVDGPRLPVVTGDVPPGWPDDEDSRRAVDMMRWFSVGYLAMVPDAELELDLLCDVRLSVGTRTLPVVCVGRSRQGLVARQPTRHADIGELWEEMTKPHPRQRPVRPVGKAMRRAPLVPEHDAYE
jgi:inner membrane protein